MYRCVVTHNAHLRHHCLHTGNIFHVKVISKMNLLNEHALVRFIGYTEDGSESSRIMELYDPITEDPIYIWRLDKIRQFVRTDIGVRVDLCQRCFRSHQQPHSHTFMVPTYFLDKCIFFLCREVGSMHIFVTQTDTDIGTTSTVYQITSHDCGSRLKPPTSPPPPPPPEIPQKRTKKKQAQPIPPRDIHRQGYADATDPLQGRVSRLTQPYVVSKRIHIDEWGNTLRLAETAPSSQMYPYHATPPVSRPPPRHRAFAYETQRDAFWRNSIIDPSPDSSPVFSPVNWTYTAFNSEAQPSLHQQSEHQQLSGSAPQQRGEEATDGDTKGERDYYNWSLFRSALNKLPSSLAFPLVREARPPPLPPRLPPRTAKSKSSPQCQLRTNQSMKFSDRQRNRDYFMEADSIVGVVPSVDRIPSSESSQLLPPVDEHESPRHVQPHASTMKPRANSPDFAEFDAFALDTMEGDSTPQRGSPVLPHVSPVSYSRMTHGGSGWDDASADDIHPGYMNMPLSSYSKVTLPQYRNLSAVRSQGFPETLPHSLEGISEGQTSVRYDDSDRGGGRHSDCNLSDSDDGNLSQEGSHRGFNKEDSNTTQHQQPGVDVVQKLDSANVSTEASSLESFHVNAETGELSPVYAGNQLPSSEAAQDHAHQPSTGPSVGHAHGTVPPDSSTGDDSSQPRGARPIPQVHSRPADNPLYASSPPNNTSMAGVLPSTLSGSAPPTSPKPLVRPKPVVKPASLHPSSSAKTQSAKQTQQRGQSPTLTRHLQEGNTPTPPKLTKPTLLPHPPPEKSQMKVTGSVAASVSHFQAKFMANQATGCHGDEQRLHKGKTMSPQAPPTGTRHPPPPAPKPTRIIQH